MVLWISAALAAVAFSLANTVRGETDRTSTQLDEVRGYYLAAGAVDRAADLFGDAARSREFRGNIETAMATMRGIALLTAVTGDTDGGGERLWRSARTRLRRLFDGSLENGSATNRPA